MKNLLVLWALTGALCLSCVQPISQYDLEIDADSLPGGDKELTIYQIASYETGCPEWVIKGIRFAESSYGTNSAHPDPLDIGDFGLHELPSYHAERALKWGEYNPYCPLQSAIIAGRIIMENYQLTGDMDQSISAYRRGLTGTRRDGVNWVYVEKVKRGGLI